LQRGVNNIASLAKNISQHPVNKFNHPRVTEPPGLVGSLIYGGRGRNSVHIHYLINPQAQNVSCPGGLFFQRLFYVLPEYPVQCV